LPILPKKGESLRQFLQYSRAARWLHKVFGGASARWAAGQRADGSRRWDQLILVPSAGDRPHELGRQAVREFGRVSPHARRLLVEALRKIPAQEGKILRGRDLPWQAVATWQRSVAAAKEEARLRLQAATFDSEAAGRRLLAHAGKPDLALAPAFPFASWERARQVVFGRSPQEIARLEDPSSDLSRAEAVAWIEHPMAKMSPSRALFFELLREEGPARDLLFSRLSFEDLRSVRVCRWLISAAKDSKRREALRASEALRHVDALLPEDIVAYSDGAQAVWDRALLRVARGEVGDLCVLPEWARTLPAGVRCLISSVELTQEGQEMSHCVGMYSNQVRSGSCRILSIRSSRGGREERSTVEISQDGRSILQHRGRANSLPPHRHRQLMTAWLRRRQ
jgi:hypothetical protein